MTDIQRLQIESGRWSDETFGAHRDATGSIAHLLKEVKELAAEPHDVTEYADCLQLLLDAARRVGITADTIVNAAWDKQDVNRHREWGEPDENGVVEHKRA